MHSQDGRKHGGADAKSLIGSLVTTTLAGNGERMSLQRLMTDSFYIEDENGNKSGPHKTKFGGKTITVFDDKLIVKEGYTVIQPLPNGTEESFIVTDYKFSSGLRAIKPHYSITIERESKLQRQNKTIGNTTYNISNSNVQVGDGNVQNIIDSFQDLVGKIDNSSASPEEKNEAKGIISTLVQNPTVAAILGGAASGLLSMM